MYKDVQKYVSACDICQKAKANTLVPVELLQPLIIPCQVWDNITIDFIEELPSSNERNTCG